MKLYDFVKKYFGTKVDFDGKFGSQCVDLFRQYCSDVLNTEKTEGVIGAKDLWLKYNDNPIERKYFHRITDHFRTGDIIVFDGTSTNDFGHVAILLEERENDFIVFEQDGFKQDGAKISCWKKQNVLGCLRRK